eukprot:6380043-Alexandrium_andersonii.AAC.1
MQPSPWLSASQGDECEQGRKTTHWGAQTAAEKVPCQDWWREHRTSWQPLFATKMLEKECWRKGPGEGAGTAMHE